MFFEGYGSCRSASANKLAATAPTKQVHELGWHLVNDHPILETMLVDTCGRAKPCRPSSNDQHAHLQESTRQMPEYSRSIADPRSSNTENGSSRLVQACQQQPLQMACRPLKQQHLFGGRCLSHTAVCEAGRGRSSDGQLKPIGGRTQHAVGNMLQCSGSRKPTMATIRSAGLVQPDRPTGSAGG